MAKESSSFFYFIMAMHGLRRRVHPRTRVGGGARSVGVGGAGVSKANGVLLNPCMSIIKKSD